MLNRLKDLALGMFFSLFVVGVLLVAAKRPAGHPAELLEPPTPRLLRVHITGAVVNPGVYALAPGSIVQEALAAAGGASARADLARLNLAQTVVDGMALVIPEMPPTPTNPPPTRTPAPTVTVGPSTPSLTPAPTATLAPQPTAAPAAVGGKININTATLAELETLPRIGPALAQRIIDYRTTNGPFTSIEQINNVRGIGDVISNSKFGTFDD